MRELREGGSERERRRYREGERVRGNEGGRAAGGAFTYKQKKALEGPVAALTPASEGASVALRSRRSGSGGVDLSRRWWMWISCANGHLVLRVRTPSSRLGGKGREKVISFIRMLISMLTPRAGRKKSKVYYSVWIM